LEVTLPSGTTVQFRDVMLRGDIREARRGMVFVTSPDGSRRTDGAFLDDLKGRIIGRMFVAWSLPDDLRNAQEHLQQQMLDRLPADDYAALEDAVEPWVQRVLRFSRTGYLFTHQASGVRFEVADAEAAQKLMADPGLMLTDSPDPKPAAPRRTGISSPESPALPGPDQAPDPTLSTSG
jgi:hypothetical protein